MNGKISLELELEFGSFGKSNLKAAKDKLQAAKTRHRL